VILEGRENAESTFSLNTEFFIYKTDIETDFYRAGLAAAALSMNNNGRIAFFIDPQIHEHVKDAFFRGLNSRINPPDTIFFASFFDYYEMPDLSCVVFAGAGVEFLEENLDIPAVLFSWLDPSMTPSSVVLVINDSPLVQVFQAVTMMSAGEENGVIRSNLSILNRLNINRGIMRNINKIK
jgi:hypothetical protein